jgi:hypothetical protein
MPIHICITCDAPDCSTATSAGFDGLGETYGDLVAALQSIDWRVETDGHSRTARCLCPEHSGARPDSGPARPDTTTPTPNSETAAKPIATP